jgi:glutamate carboxypeptidase
LRPAAPARKLDVVRGPLVHVLATLLLAANLPAPSGAATLAPAERRAVSAIDGALSGALELLERLVNQNSGTLDTAGVAAVARMLAPELESLGFRSEWRDGRTWGRAGHLLAFRRGARARHALLLIGHLDTVFELDSPFQRLERLPDGRWRGPGVCDMKGGDVEMLLVVRALRAASVLERFDVRIVLNGDEERTGRPTALARADLLAAAAGCELAIGFEDGAGDPAQAVVARRGAQGWRLRTAGHAAHSSQIFREGVGAGAVYEAARILEAFRDTLASEPHLTCNAGLVLGGSRASLEGDGARGSAAGKTNVVPESTVVTGDLRALTDEQFERARATMTRIVSRHLPGTDAAIEFEEAFPPLAPGPGHDELLTRFDAASRALGLGPVAATNPDDAGAADISFVGGIVPRALDGVGLAGSGGHSAHETGDPAVLGTNAKRVAVMLIRYDGGAEAR